MKIQSNYSRNLSKDKQTTFGSNLDLPEVLKDSPYHMTNTDFNQKSASSKNLNRTARATDYANQTASDVFSKYQFVHQHSIKLDEES